MTPDLDAIEARIAAAPVGGEWRVYRQSGEDFYSWRVGVYDARNGWVYDVARCDYQSDADLIAHAPTDLAALVAEVRTLRRVAEAAEAMLSGLIVDYDAGNTDRQMNDLSAALDAWRAGGGA